MSADVYVDNITQGPLRMIIPIMFECQKYGEERIILFREYRKTINGFVRITELFLNCIENPL